MAPICAQSATLNKIVDSFIKNNPELSRLKAEVSAGKSGVNEAKRAYLPSISLNGRALKQDAPRINAFAPKPPDKIYSTFLELYQPIYLGGQIAAGIKGRNAEYNLAKMQLDYSKNQLLVGLISDLMDYNVKLKELKVLKSSEKTVRSFLRTTRKRHKSGGARDYELAQVESDYYSYGPRLLAKDLEIQNLKTKISISSGLADFSKIDWDWEKIPNIEALLRDSKKINTLTSRSDYAVLLEQKKLAEVNTKLNTAEFKPTLNITGQWGYQGYETSRNMFKEESESESIALNLTIPVFSGFRKSAVKSAGLSKEDSISSQIESFKLNFGAELSQSLETLTRSQSNLKNTKKWRSKAYSALTSAQRDFKKGLITQADIVQLQRSYELAETGYLSSLKTFYLAKINREFILGKDIEKIYGKDI